ncbi:7,8-didemethyl-8-hydroxy-5-deazariboflavin synthase CofG, partial [Leucobacter sp. M11]|uniref:7,8-didemethyl-8-hydroxy-5-deazariboflavin synthase CofG n=1 Tax=Leucobacter sp. M11 TaxID=2993565 RepID=UPI002D7F629C
MMKSELAPDRARERALGRAEQRRAITRDEAIALVSARGAELDRLCRVAAAVRDEGLARRGTPRTLTYSRKVFVPLTTLCRDRCHYCVFVDTPNQLARQARPVFQSPETVLEIARAGAAAGCREVLFTLGDRPEARWPVADAWLRSRGYASTLDYVSGMAALVHAETGLLPHINPGVMTWAELERLRPTAPSMGMMLETTSRQLWSEHGSAHYGSPDKDPALRLRVLEDAGRARVPFSTGILLGIGEGAADRVDALLAIRASRERWGHIQEVIVQNYRAKPATAMRDVPDFGAEAYRAAIAVARLLLGPDARVQVPPNLSDEAALAGLIGAGIDDWGGVSPVTPDHVNPERPWPELDRLAHLTERAGYRLRERLTAHAEYLDEADGWVD